MGVFKGWLTQLPKGDIKDHFSFWLFPYNHLWSLVVTLRLVLFIVTRGLPQDNEDRIFLVYNHFLVCNQLLVYMKAIQLNIHIFL